MILELLTAGVLVLHGPSWHSTSRPNGERYEWATFGVGWRIQREGWGMQAGAYRNSYGRPALYGGVAVGGRAGLFGGAASGYIDNALSPLVGVYVEISSVTVRAMPLIRAQKQQVHVRGAVLTVEYRLA